MNLIDRLLGQDIKTHAYSDVTTGTSVLMVNALKALVNPPSIFMGVVGTGVQLDIASSSVADVMTSGTGAWQITVVGLGPNFIPQVKVYNLNGQTVVTPPDFWLRVFGAYVSAVGTGLVAAGDIYIVKTGTGTFTTGVPATVTSGCLKIPIANGSGYSGYWTVPATRTGAQPRKAKLQGVTIGAAAQNSYLLIQAQPNLDGAIYPSDIQLATVWDLALSGSGGGPGWVDLNRHIEDFTPGTDIIFRFIPGTAGAIISVAADIKMV